jgi:hypothetical protein
MSVKLDLKLKGEQKYLLERVDLIGLIQSHPDRESPWVSVSFICS